MQEDTTLAVERTRMHVTVNSHTPLIGVSTCCRGHPWRYGRPTNKHSLGMHSDSSVVRFEVWAAATKGLEEL